MKLNIESERQKVNTLEAALKQEQLTRQQVEEQLGDAQNMKEAVAVAEAEAQQARREQRRLEQTVAAARDAVIRMGPRLGVLAGQEVSTTLAGKHSFQQGGLEDAVAACEVLMPKLEQRAQEALAAREQAENRAAECERQLLDVATATSTFRETFTSSGPILDSGLAGVNNAAANQTAGREGQQSAGGRRVVSAGRPRQTCVERGRCAVM